MVELIALIIKGNYSKEILVLVAIISLAICYTLFKCFVFFWEKVWPKMRKKDQGDKEDLLREVKKIIQESSINFMTKDDIIKKINNLILEHENRSISNEDLTQKIHDIYLAISDMKEKYAETMVKREELKEVMRDINKIEGEIIKIKSYLTME